MGKYSVPYAFVSFNPDDKIRKSSSSGGVFSLLAKKILEENGTVYGAAFDADFNVSHIRIDKIPDLKKIRGSKYVYSNFAPIFTLVEEDLKKDRKVLFSGVPCQIAALKKFLADKDYNSEPLYVEVICHGSPEQRYWKDYLDEVCKTNGFDRQEIVNLNFRDKSTGWKNYSFKLDTKDKIISEPFRENIYMRMFLENYILREACFKCPFKGENSKADIILGDLWGSRELCPDLDDDRGLSVVIVRSQNGVNAIDSLPIVKMVDIKDVIRFNPSLVYDVPKPYGYENFKRKYRKNRHKILAMKLALSQSFLDKLKLRLSHFCKVAKL